ncbi:hypothetical protein [Furfurilactobacillus rossiae]|uniref:Uncharacterized protein n=1 Tax=Furfurilactobacillus rossiae DSM 15814 TaxID=1114972 RepID=A0A0R1RAN1_9LACO|nr:hypothetical protein [Furfurilactobacillus rossiae]KRL54007.1 hypothetical protein FD35_GL000710 [Furfurilactobacillus rossiae DSM 15814]QFR68157.1 hypothetical protein LR814_13375 [Furfurilactobacillus rossiae]QLE62677.1 hypothetical protein LROSRS0_p10041 [Furfurilactobacillus rossiae]
MSNQVERQNKLPTTQHEDSLQNSESRITVLLSKQNDLLFAQLKDWARSQGTDVNNGKLSDSGLFNFVLATFGEIFLATPKRANQRYAVAKSKAISGIDGDDLRDHLDSRLTAIMDRITENYYLTMATNVTLTRADPDNFLKIESMYDKDTTEFAIHKNLHHVVREDANRNALLKQQQRRRKYEG